MSDKRTSLLERIDRRLRAVWDISIPEMREYAGVHDYDGEVMDLSPEAVSQSLRRLGVGEPPADRHDADHLAAVEDGIRAAFDVAELHRWNPLVHVANLDLSCYDREYAPLGERQEKRRNHLSRWPDAVDSSLSSLDAVPRPVASALLGGAKGLAVGVEDEAALAALGRLVESLEAQARSGREDCSLGAATLTRLLGDAEGLPVDLGRLEERADAERGRLAELLSVACERLSPGTPPRDLVSRLVEDHPPADGLYEAARALINEVTEFTLSKNLIPDPGGTCLVGPAPESRRWAMAMMSPGGAYEAEAPGWYHVNPPDSSWTLEEQEEWLGVFSATTLPAITAHEVTPGHFAHGRIMAKMANSDVRRSLASSAFVEGWAHYAEELMVEEGFRSEDPRFAIGVYMEALLRVTRFACAIGIHTGSMSVEEATRRFEEDAFLKGPAARAEAMRGTYDPTYGRYTWGKLEIRALRDQAVASWGNRYSHRRFHEALLSLGSPPLGTIGDALGD